MLLQCEFFLGNMGWVHEVNSSKLHAMKFDMVSLCIMQLMEGNCLRVIGTSVQERA
jgi:hypothetical protein